MLEYFDGYIYAGATPTFPVTEMDILEEIREMEEMPPFPEELPLYANELTQDEPINETSEPTPNDRTVLYQGNEFMFIEE